ncbi:hypothetical protein [Buttiauxella noackiae]|jgi:hypothetical protein|uniref:Secreted protein n=1 Tax=Buttiauxella noackiae ATCC 51607 TaxID=1354255 RepID=A0A1B7I1E6_9ENTR|nr:hypothetical protein [Buttiauxella noackiae]OAT21956.1 hypothetical protein M979_0046 [Buttiauxella noackiae ATCC 51607]
MKKLTLSLMSGMFLFVSAGAFAENPATSTSGMQAEKEQLNNPGHIIDDCRAPGNVDKKGCEPGHEMRKEHKGNEKMLEKGGTTDDVMQKDVQKTN